MVQWWTKYRRSFIGGCFIGTLIGSLPFAAFLAVHFHFYEHLDDRGVTPFNFQQLVDQINETHRKVEFLQYHGSHSRWMSKDAEPINLLTERLITSRQLSIDGWWMSHSKWDVSMECGLSNGLQGPAQCAQVFTAVCKKQVTTAVYQFLPIENTSRIIGVHFEAKAASVSKFKWNEDVKVLDKAVNSVLMLLKYTDETHDTARLIYPVGNNNSLMSAGTSKMLPTTKKLKSITTMLTCYGYNGDASFRDIVIKPIFDGSVMPSSVKKNRKRSISGCPHYYKPEEASIPFDIEKVLSFKHLQKETNNMTLVTHLSIDRIDILQKSLAVWTGFMSISVFVPVYKANNNMNITEPILQRSRRYLEDTLSKVKLPDRCSLVAVYARSEKDEYPTNSMRNLGIREVKTEYMTLLDVDFVPCPDFEKKFFKALKTIRSTSSKIAYVVPVFEGSKQVTAADLPRSKAQLKKMVRGEDPFLVPFAYHSSPLSHEYTNYTKWYSSWTPYRVPLNEDVYEPYLILSTRAAILPTFDTRFTGYGFNKIQFTMELEVRGYTALVLPNVWATHLYHRISVDKKQFLNGPTTRLQNRIKRYEYVAELMRKYKLGACADT